MERMEQPAHTKPDSRMPNNTSQHPAILGARAHEFPGAPPPDSSDPPLRSASRSRSRAQRLMSGDLIDVSEQARSRPAGARFIVPVAITTALAADISDLSGHYVLSTDTPAGRLDALLGRARSHAGSHLDYDRFSFSCYMPVADATTYYARLRLHAGDELEDVITLDKERPPQHRQAQPPAPI